MNGTACPKLPLDAHPLPWKLGGTNGPSTQIVDANGRYVASVNKGGILLGHAGTPQMVVDLINAYGQIE